MHRMYSLLLLFIKKKFPKTYLVLKIIKNKIYFNKNYIKSNNLRTKKLINSLSKESYYDFKKKEFLKNLNKKSKVGIIEINNSCNINCVMCDTKSSTRQKKLMSLELCEKSIKEMRSEGIESILLHTIGDPLANSKLNEYFKILKKYKMQVGLSTNGLMLEKHIDTLVENFEICSNIRFSIDGVKKTTYEKIRYGGNFEKLIENLNLAEKKLKPLGYEFMVDLVITKENINELGEFIVFFRKYVNNPYKNIHLGFMNSLSPSNDYFNKNNTMEKHTSINFFCKYASHLTPYILVDGRVSACCRDYDGSLVIDDIYKNKLKDIYTNSGFKQLQQAHLEENSKLEKYNLCKSCYVVDSRITEIWNNTICALLYKHPKSEAEFYQNKINDLIIVLKNINSDNFNKFLIKHTLN